MFALYYLPATLLIGQNGVRVRSSSPTLRNLPRKMVIIIYAAKEIMQKLISVDWKVVADRQ